MPYYCTVPRCTSMAGKAKNVSFHQFPRDEELAKLWNDILKRGKPYTKYSKVCSLHFKPEDYTITSVGKNKGQWRTLRKDAIPSQNLPSETPGPYVRRERNTGSWVPSSPPPGFIDPRMQQQMAQAIYVQTMLAMHAAGATEALAGNPINGLPIMKKEIDNVPHPTIEQLLRTQNASPKTETTSYKCTECLKCFKDPDVFILHKRSHTKEDSSGSEKENTEEHMLKANPILANLLKVNTEGNINNINNSFDTNNILSIENHIMAALAVNMESYIRNLSSMMNNRDENADESTDEDRSPDEMGLNEGSRVINEGEIGLNEVEMGINEVNRSIEDRGINEGDNRVNEGDSEINEDDGCLNENSDLNEGNKSINDGNICLNEVNGSINDMDESVMELDRLVNEERRKIESADSNNLVIDEDA